MGMSGKKCRVFGRKRISDRKCRVFGKKKNPGISGRNAIFLQEKWYFMEKMSYIWEKTVFLGENVIYLRENWYSLEKMRYFWKNTGISGR